MAAAVLCVQNVAQLGAQVLSTAEVLALETPSLPTTPVVRLAVSEGSLANSSSYLWVSMNMTAEVLALETSSLATTPVIRLAVRGLNEFVILLMGQHKDDGEGAQVGQLNEFVILLMGQHKYGLVTFSYDCPTCGVSEALMGGQAYGEGKGVKARGLYHYE